MRLTQKPSDLLRGPCLVDTWSMAKIQGDPITEVDLREFVAKDSDFAFEMQVLAQLQRLEFDCSHSGTYQDPVSDKIRQFDIRAQKNKGSCTLALAVECKNLRPNHPLLLSAVPRTDTEAFHDLLIYEASKVISYPKVTPVVGNQSAYKPGEMVGKKTDQVGRDSEGSLVSDDSTTFDRFNQAVNSCKDLVHKFAFNSSLPLNRAIVPVLVVPEGLLYQVDYAADGRTQVLPRRVTRATLFLNHTWSVERNWGPINYRLSHIELVTLDALPDIVGIWLGSSGFFSAF